MLAGLRLILKIRTMDGSFNPPYMPQERTEKVSLGRSNGRDRQGDASSDNN